MKYFLNLTILVFSLNIYAQNISIGIIEEAGYDYKLDSLKTHINEDSIGYDVREGDLDPYEKTDTLEFFGKTTYLYSHATHVLDVITQKTSPQIIVKLLRLPPSSWIQRGDYYTQTEWNEKSSKAIESLYDSGVRIFNISQGDGKYINTGIFKYLCSVMHNLKDSVFVVAAGNNSENLDDKKDEYVTYPQECTKSPNILIVGSSARRGKHSFSNYGIKTVDVFADGKNVKSLDLKISGTSFAAPFVAKTIAEIQLKSQIFSAMDAKNYLVNNCKKRKRLQKISVLGCLITTPEVKRLLKSLD